jgi:hypothetical protein
MIGPVNNRPSAPIRPAAPVRRRSPRMEIELDATIESEGVAHTAQVRDVSTTGAAIFGSKPKLSNDMFVELHMEGHRSLKASVVREFPDGYAVQFNDADKAISAQELSEFKNAARSGI